MTRQPPIQRPTDDQVAALVERQNRDIILGGLTRAGIKESTLKKFQSFDDFGHNAGAFLVASLSMSHKMLVYGLASLIEQADEIKTWYLDDMTLKAEDKVLWQKEWSNIWEMIGRSHDRILQSTEALVRIQAAKAKNKKGGSERTKPGFGPLLAVNKPAAEAGGDET